jgi:Ni,Fe-hydrogenase III large subunit
MQQTFRTPRSTLSTPYDVPAYSEMLPGPMRLQLELLPASDNSPLGWGAEVASADVKLGYNYVGLEERVASGGLTWATALGLMEKLCGCCTQANTLAFAQAVESLGSLAVPPRALYMRLVLVEAERIVSHLLNAASTMEALGLADREALLRDLRERVVVAVEEWAGEHTPNLITYGGLARNIGEAPSKTLAAAALNVERTLRTYVTDVVNSKEIARRLVGLGRITAQEALLAGLRGPVARASGITVDLRANVPTGAYETEGVTIISQRGGDAFSRLVVRLLECLESFRVIEQALDDLPLGPVKGKGDLDVRDGSALGRVEGPRGEVFCWVRGGADGLRGLHLSTGSFPSVGVIPGLLADQRLEDVRLLLLSVDLCLPSIER